MPFHIRPKILIIIYLHLFLVTFIEFGVIGCLKNVGEVVFLTIDGVLGVRKDAAKGLFAGFARVLVRFFQSILKILRFA